MRKWIHGAIAAAVIGTAVVSTQVWAASSNSGVPGSADDPVVTKSYVDQQIQNVSGGGTSLKVVELTGDKVLYGYEGTEFIVRTGSVVSVAGKNGDGLTDLTAGADLRAGAWVSANHLLLIARSDSRGLRLAPGYDGIAYVMVRGKYTLK